MPRHCCVRPSRPAAPTQRRDGARKDDRSASGVVAGVDAHTDEHHAAVLDAQGRLLGDGGLPDHASGYAQLISWLRRHGEVERVGVESTGAYAAGLVRALLAQRDLRRRGQPAAPARPPAAGQERPDRRRARRPRRAERHGDRRCRSRPSGIVEAIRQLQRRPHRRAEGAHRRTAAARRSPDHRARAATRRAPPRPHAEGEGGALPAAAPRHEPPARAAPGGQARAAQPRPSDPRPRPRDRSSSTSELERLVATAAPRTVALFGVGTQGAGQLLVTAGQNIERLRGEAAFAKLCAAAPIQASSGRTNRHRLDYGGDRQANRALHMIAVCRLRHCPRTRAYAAAAPPKASTAARSSAASSATSPARSTTPSAPTSKRSTHLTSIGTSSRRRFGSCSPGLNELRLLRRRGG